MYRGYFPYDELSNIPSRQMASFAESCNWNIKIEQDPVCTGAYSVDPIYAYARHLPVQYATLFVEEADGYDKKYDVLKKVDRVFSFEIFTNAYIEKFLVEMAFSSQKILLSTAGDSPISIGAENIRISSEEISKDVYKTTVTYSSDDLAAISFGLSICCESIYSGDEPSPPDPGDIDCNDMTASATLSEGTITLTVSGAPSTINSVWTYSPAGGGPPLNIGSNISSASTIGYGQYKITVTSGPCTKITGVSFLDPFTGFYVNIQRDGDVLEAIVDTAHDPVDTYQWSYSEDGSSWTDLGTEQVQIATEGEGFYKVVATLDGEDRSSIIFISGETLCDFDGEIVVEGNDLSWITEDDVTVISYEWKKDNGNGDGLVVIPDATSETITADETGYYTVTVTTENCAKTFTIMHPMCGDCATFDAAITEEAGVLTAIVEGCAEPSFAWSFDTGTGKDIISTSDTITPEVDGMYFLEVCCLNCTPQVFIIFKSGDTFSISDNSLPGGGKVWGAY